MSLMAVDNRIAKDEVMDKLREVCEEIIANDTSHIEQTKRCVCAFSALREKLNDEQKQLLYILDEELARQDLIKTSIILELIRNEPTLWQEE